MHCALFWYRHKQVIFVLLLPCSTWADWKSWLVAEEMKCVNDGGVLEDVISTWDLDTLAVLQLVHRCDSVSSLCDDFVFIECMSLWFQSQVKAVSLHLLFDFLSVVAEIDAFMCITIHCATLNDAGCCQSMRCVDRLMEKYLVDVCVGWIWCPSAIVRVVASLWRNLLQPSCLGSWSRLWRFGCRWRTCCLPGIHSCPSPFVLLGQSQACSWCGLLLAATQIFARWTASLRRVGGCCKRERNKCN